MVLCRERVAVRREIKDFIRIDDSTDYFVKKTIRKKQTNVEHGANIEMSKTDTCKLLFLRSCYYKDDIWVGSLNLPLEAVQF